MRAKKNNSSNGITEMSALCIAQPWAQCVVEHGKNVENKKANLKKRGTIAIYASTRNTPEWFDACKREFGINLNWDKLPKGAIVGFVDVVDVITDETVGKNTRKWYIEGRYGYVLENPVMLKTPVEAKPPRGAISFWYLTGKSLSDCLEQVPKERLAKFKPFAAPEE